MVMLGQTKRVVKILTENLQIFKRMNIFNIVDAKACLALYDLNQRQNTGYQSALNLLILFYLSISSKFTLYLINDFTIEIFLL